MAAGVPHQWLRIVCNLWIVLHLCWTPGVNGDVQVPDGVVYTELQRTTEIGKPLVLTCRFYGTPIAVYWKKGVDPTTAPNLITWVDGESASGSCVNDRSCNITGDYSLVIRSVKVSDQGSYICRVSNYLGVLIHNFTEVTVFAAPSEPYPLIEECQPISNDPQSCRLPASDSVTITCTASKYFPDIDLFFLRESITTNATYSQIGEETNVDGTKNKSVSIVARPSENPYVCVASRIPGSPARRTVSVTVYTIESTVAMTTTQTNRTIPPHQRHGAAKVVVPLILITLVAVLVCLFIWWYRKRQASKYGMYIT
nr:CD276 antigen-like [Lytechinus pictus]